MAIAGRSYPNVPIIIRGSLEDPADFDSKTSLLVVTSQPAAAQTAVPPVTILRGSLEDPADFGSKTQLVIVAAQPDRRWFAPATVLTAVNPATQPATVGIPPPVVIAAQPDRRWLAVNPPSFAVGSPTAAPAIAQQGTVTITNILAGSVTIVNDL